MLGKEIVISVSTLLGCVGSTVSFAFLLLSFFVFIWLKREKLLLYYIFMQIAFFFYVVGYTVYTSSESYKTVLLFFKLCFTGAFLTPLAFALFIKALIKDNNKRLYIVFSIIISVFLVLIWIKTPYFVTNKMIYHPQKFYYSIERGNSFKYLVFIIEVITIIAFVRFVKFYRTVKFDKSVYIFFILGFFIWVSNSFYDALVSMNFLDTPPMPWLGPIFMTILTGFYVGNYFYSASTKLDKALNEIHSLENKVIRDPLTQVFSRTYFTKKLEYEFIRNDEEYGKLCNDCILFCDLDNFKSINDKEGHQTGDEVLKIFADTLNGHIRKNDIIARFGGDEFLVLLINCTEEDGIKIAEVFKSNFSKNVYNQLGIDESVSIGLCHSKYWNKDVNVILHNADKALYKAKTEGKNKVYAYND